MPRDCSCLFFNSFKPEFTIIIFIHYKPRIAVAILGGGKCKKTYRYYYKIFTKKAYSKNPGFGKDGHSSEMRNDSLMPRES